MHSSCCDFVAREEDPLRAGPGWYNERRAEKSRTRQDTALRSDPVHREHHISQPTDESAADERVWIAQDDDGFILYESRAICRYLAAKFRDQGPDLLPAGVKENALFEQAASIELNNFEPYANNAVAEVVFKPYAS